MRSLAFSSVPSPRRSGNAIPRRGFFSTLLERWPAQAPVEGVEVLVPGEVDEQPAPVALALQGDRQAECLLEAAAELLVIGGEPDWGLAAPARSRSSLAARRVLLDEPLRGAHGEPLVDGLPAELDHRVLVVESEERAAVAGA